MAKSIEDLLISLKDQADIQNGRWMDQQHVLDTRHAFEMKTASREGRDQAKYDKFATEQQGQEVQLSKRNQMHTAQLRDKTELLLDAQGDLVESGKPRWDAKQTVMTKKDAENIVKTGVKEEQLDELISLGKGEKANESFKQKKLKQNDEMIEDKKEKGRVMMARQYKAQLDNWVDSNSSFSNFTGAVKTDMSLIFGSLGVLTSLPGINTILTGSRVIASNMLKFFTGILGPKLWSGLKDIGKSIRETKADDFKRFGITQRLAKVRDGISEKWNKKMGKDSTYGGFISRSRVKMKLASQDPSRDAKGRIGKGVIPTRFGRIMANFGSIIKLLNPFKKMVLIAAVAIGGLFALFKGTDGQGLFAKLTTMWTKIKSFFTTTIEPMLKSLWTNVLIPLKNVFMNDIVPMFGHIFEDIIKPLFFNVVVPLANVLGKIFGAIMKLYTWIYDRIFKPLMKWFGWMGGVDVDEMDKSQLENEKGALNRQKDRPFGLDREGEQKLWEVEQRLKSVTPNTSGQDISNGASISSAFDINSALSNLGLGSSGPQLVTANHQTVNNTGPRSFISRTDSGFLEASRLQGINIVHS